jgi:hypothetical protein
MREHIKTNFLDAFIRECWVRKDNLRVSCIHQGGFNGDPTWHAIVLESITVGENHRREGHCRRFIETLATDARFDLAIIEGVRNPHLADALIRWGWDCDVGVMDFFRRTEDLDQLVLKPNRNRT